MLFIVDFALRRMKEELVVSLDLVIVGSELELNNVKAEDSALDIDIPLFASEDTALKVDVL